MDPIRGGVGLVSLIKFYRNERWGVWGDSAVAYWRSGSLKRPEPPDTWERIEADVEACDGSACRYFKRDYSPMKHSCEGCRSADVDEGCMLYAMQDVLERAKKLAGVE